MGGAVKAAGGFCVTGTSGGGWGRCGSCCAASSGAVTVDLAALPNGRLELDGRWGPRPPRLPSLREGAKEEFH